MAKRRNIQRLLPNEGRDEIDLLTITAHELKSPLTLISGLSSMLLKNRQLGARQRRNLSSIMRTSDRLLVLVEGLVAAGKLKNGQWQIEREPVILHKLLEPLLGELEPRLSDSRIKLTVDRTYALTPILADADCLYHAIYNLLDNAIKYSPAQARLAIRPHREHMTAIIDIENTSRDLNTSQLEQLIDQKVTDQHKPLLKSSGLGLYIVQSLIEAQGGSVLLKLERDFIRFRIRLPTVRQLPLFENNSRVQVAKSESAPLVSRADAG